jgi:hypothetical protein
MQSFDTTMRLAEIRRDELLRAGARGRLARLTSRRRRRETTRRHATQEGT